mmetsp:Transcript_12494/g.25445  ORF Transcript_12494/g.25445 Transcript_12494/m.25445 type:complete len:112 (+) Transcript_12494:126-461(+)
MPRQVRNDNDSMGTQSPPQSSASPFSLHSLESSMLFSRSVRRLDRMARDLYMREQTLQVSPALIVLQCGAPHERFRLARHLQVQGLVLIIVSGLDKLSCVWRFGDVQQNRL